MEKRMTYWPTVGLVTVIAFVGTRSGGLLYWWFHMRSRGEPAPKWREAFKEAWSAFVASAVALALYGK